MLKLLYLEQAVANVRDEFLHQGTWFGTFELLPAMPQGAERVVEYVEFCIDWNERARQDAADADEFDKFSDLIGSHRWKTLDDSGALRQIEDAPLFFKDAEVSWRLAE